MIRPFRLRRATLINLFWIPLSLQDAAVMAIAVPAKLLQLSPVDYRRDLSIIASIVAFAAMVVPAFAGALSDWLRRRGFDRRGLIVAGALIDAPALCLCGLTHSMTAFIGLLVISAIGFNVSIAAYQAVIPDVVPRQSWGLVSGVRGAAALIGTIIGLAIAGATNPRVSFLAIGILIGVGVLTLALLDERPVGDQEASARVKDWYDFILVFIARGFVVFGLTILTTFVLYFFRDVLHNANPSGGTGLVAGCSVFGALLSSVWLGIVSDRVPRKLVAALSCVPMAVAGFGFALVPSESWILAFGGLFGIGFGGALSTGWALGLESVPKMRDVARDLGIWGIASNLPAVLAPLFGGWLLARTGGSLDGYRMVFASAGIGFGLATTAILATRGAASTPTRR
ncbi:MAG: MFS transporter [Candidatus Eremiobacteraeota bacterium]|nr:MFS transporter [Candidatus Eremiobacteraeota bacterium]MBV9973329.1 MFS transporter [Candidatus Eremiobacteraeota bacterium]